MPMVTLNLLPIILKKTEIDISNEHQIISVDDQDTDEDTNCENTNYLAYILNSPQSIIEGLATIVR